MADKSTHLMVNALSRAAAAPDGLPLFAAKASPGLFPHTAAARVAARRCKDDGFLQVLEASDNSAREQCRLTDKGRSWLMHHVSPRQVLEDFVRVLEDRRHQADDLVNQAQQMIASLNGLKTAVEQLRPLVNRSALNGEHHREKNSAPCSPRLAESVFASLKEWHAASPGDCPLPELFRRVQESHRDLSIGVFHDGLRELHEQHRVYLHPWTGPLYDLPEPPFALLIGHEIAYYASHRNTERGTRNAE